MTSTHDGASVKRGLAVVTDRGGHLHNAVMLLDQMGVEPEFLVTTYGPDIDAAKQFPQLRGTRVCTVPYLFSWWNKFRYLHPLKVVGQFVKAGYWAWKLKPKQVVSLGATNVVFFSWWAWVFGADIYHVECMNQVVSKSITGKMLYPICRKLYVQWRELLPQYGAKAEYAGWVL